MHVVIFRAINKKSIQRNMFEKQEIGFKFSNNPKEGIQGKERRTNQKAKDGRKTDQKKKKKWKT